MALDMAQQLPSIVTDFCTKYHDLRGFDLKENKARSNISTYVNAVLKKEADE